MSADFATVRKMFETNNAIFQKAIDGIPDEEWLKQAGDDSNPLVWIAGHMIVSRALVPRMFGQDWSAPWEKLFARGAKRVSPEQYPSPAEVRKAWAEVSEKLSAALANASADTLSKPTKEGSPSLDGTVGGSVAMLCLHETYHVGQAGYLRKWLGHGQSVG
jgi:uncharacterized damage-inducible protein DinB